MAQSRFDIVVAGSTPAAVMAAALLARNGRRVLHLTSAIPPDPWQSSSLFLRKVLETLSGQACLVAAQPLQVLSARARVTIHPAVPLADELTREFGAVGNQVDAVLAELEALGERLEQLLWEYGGLPAEGLRARAGWRWLCLRRKLATASLSAPLAPRLHALPEAATEWLTDLFQGLAMQPLAALSVADGALLWAQARRGEAVAGGELPALLQKRFEQFHGVTTERQDLAALEHRSGLWNGSLRNGGSFQASQLLLGDLDQELPGHGFPAPRHPLTPPQQLLTSPLDGQLSLLLAGRVIAGGRLPLRLVLTTTPVGLIAHISASVLADEAQIRRQLDPVLPFARYTLQVQAIGRNTVRLADPATTAPSLFRLPLHPGTHLWCADHAGLLPQLGSGGAALLAWTLLRRLQPGSGRR
jgi:hypothetical protein